MGKGRPRAVERPSLAHPSTLLPSTSLSPIPQAPVFHPTESEFSDPLEYLSRIRSLAEPYGICRIVPPASWSPPPFSLSLSSFPTKSQQIHLLQSRLPSSDPYTFKLDYSRFLTSQLQRKLPKKPPVFEGEPLDLCRLFNAVKRFGGYETVCRVKRWGDVALFVRDGQKVSECAKHVLSQLYFEHLYDYENFTSNLGTKKEKKKGKEEFQSRKRRKKSTEPVAVHVKSVVRDEFDQICEQCKSGLHGDVMLLCDRCDKGWHLYCLSPPLESIPSGNWYCLECVNSDEDSFGFVPGKNRSLEEFKRMDDRIRKKWFGQRNSTRTQIEKKFWEIVEGKAGELEVMYGSDLDTSVYGSGFPHESDPIPSNVDLNLWREYCDSPWNLNNFPKLDGSILRAVRENITGVMVPWLYVGMLFSSFCWHVEDHCFYSINYLHWGEPKCWYGVPGSAANAFEQVMRNALPDLFDTQPDLLFQLVTMLNPSVLQENGVPVYSVMQEPGNFVITFPRSFHGGFNSGLNCAEAVNFATADWLPHGGVGAELYRRYHKAAVLSHEELLCVVAKNGCDAKALPYLKEEIERVFSKEKKFREELWVNGIIRSNKMSPKIHPEFVGTEEDPTCVICHQYLYLSAVTCSCRPSAYVCLEDWRHLCECSLDKHKLLYRHTLAELNDLIRASSTLLEPNSSCENSQSNLQSPKDSTSLSKKMKGGDLSFTQLAEDWLSNSYHILEIPFVVSNYRNALKEAEQFLWADHDMDAVRAMADRLVQAEEWALNVRGCLSKINNFNKTKDSHKAMYAKIAELLSVGLMPCRCEPGLADLKPYAEDAEKLSSEIKLALSSRLTVPELELLCSRVAQFPIHLTETTALSNVISSAKIWSKNACQCLAETNPGAVEINRLNKLRAEMQQLCVHVPEMDQFLELCKEADSWKLQCEEFLKCSLKLKELEDFLESTRFLKFNIEELNQLRQHYRDASSWVCSVNNLFKDISTRADYENIVRELFLLLKASESLRVKVEELAIVEVELRRAMCRKRALEVFSVRVPIEMIEQVLTDASLLNIEGEKLFIQVSEVLKKANSWEEKTRFILDHSSHLSIFEDLIRCSEDIFAILPSLPDIKQAVSVARSWLDRSQPFLNYPTCDRKVFGEGFFKVSELKELIVESKKLNVTIDEPQRLEVILERVKNWEKNAFNLLEEFSSFLSINGASSVVEVSLLAKCEELFGKINGVIEAGSSLGFDFTELPQLKSAASTVKLIQTALSFCIKIPSIKELDVLLENASDINVGSNSSKLDGRLIKGINWLRKALNLIPDPEISNNRCKLEDVEITLGEYQENLVPYPMIVSCLQDAIKKHKCWVEQCNTLFVSPGQKSWTVLSKLKESSKSDAFDCPEMYKVNSKIEDVIKWVSKCQSVIHISYHGNGSLLSQLERIKWSLDKALSLYVGSKGCMEREFCICCSCDLEDKGVYTCSSCGDRYHILCVGPPLATSSSTTDQSACPFCQYLESGKASQIAKQALLQRGNRPDFSSFVELISLAEGLCTGVKEFDLVQEIVALARKCKSNFSVNLDTINTYHEKDLGYISQSLLITFKTVAVSQLYDELDSCSLYTVLTRYSWKLRMNKLLTDTGKPALQQILQLEEEGLALGIPSEDHFMLETTKIKQISLHWLEKATKVTADLGDSPLNEVYDLLSDGEHLPVNFETELKMLRERTVLYCICRRPYDNRAMIACDQCDEWYHFDCINLRAPPPKVFYCPACRPANGQFILLPPSLSLCHDHLPGNQGEQNREPILKKELTAVNLIEYLKGCSEIDGLWWGIKRSLERTARRRTDFKCFS